MGHGLRIQFREEKPKYNFGRCPACNMFSILQKGVTDSYHNRVYKCLKCSKLSASPTEWSHCRIKGTIAKDLWNNDCKCFPECKQYLNAKVCPNWQGKVEDSSELKGQVKKIIGGKK